MIDPHPLDPDALTASQHAELTGHAGQASNPAPARPPARPPVHRNRACWWCGNPLPASATMFDRTACRRAWHRHWTIGPGHSALDVPDQPPPDEARRIADDLEQKPTNQEDHDG